MRKLFKEPTSKDEMKNIAFNNIESNVFKKELNNQTINLKFNTMKKRNLLATAIVFIASIYTTKAQSVGSAYGDDRDILLVNKDASAHYGQVRMQTGQNGYTLANYNDRFGLFYTSGTTWSTIGTELFTIRENGNVGLDGVNDPKGEFQFKNVMNNRKMVLWQDADNNHQFSGFGINDGILRYQAANSHAFFTAQSTSSSKEAMRILNNGNIGIGLSNPTQNLQVKDNAQINNLFLGDVGLGTGWASIANSSKKSLAGYALASSNDGKYTVLNIEGNSSGYIGFRVANNDKMVINNTGKVGIGTTAPNGELQFGNTQNNKKIVLWEDAANDHQFYGLGVNTNMLRYQSSNDHVFYSAVNASSSKETLRIYKDGGIKTDKVVLNIGTFPDYVFAEKYSLMPIEQVADYIRVNKHLPNIPSEKEVVHSGLNIGEMNVKMVEKIEELTLYTIQQNEKIKSQENLINTLMLRLSEMEKKMDRISK